MTTNQNTRIAALSALVAAILAPGQSAQAAGFALMEQNTSGLGNAYAGSAAVAEDASTVFFNSAGLTELKRPSLVLNASLINVNSRFTDTGSAAALGQSLGGMGGNAGSKVTLPALYAAVPLGHGMTGGVGINAPFGLKTEYSADWLGRFQAIKSEVKTLNVNTALAFKVSSVMSLGVGLNYQTLDAELTKGVNYAAVVAQGAQQLAAAGQINAATAQALIAAGTGLQGSSSVKGNDSTWGYDLGLLFNFNDRTRVGLSYRSATKYSVQGNARFVSAASSNATVQSIINSANAATLAEGPVTLDIELPASERLAIAQKVGSKVELLGEVSWTQWNSIPELRVKRTNGVTLSNTTENWENTWRYAIGANFQVTPAVKLRIGGAIDQSPVPDSTRTPRLPDNDRTWLAAGAKIAVNGSTSVDLGYSRVTAKDATLNQNDGSTSLSGLIAGKQKTSIDVFGVQATVTF